MYPYPNRQHNVTCVVSNKRLKRMKAVAKAMGIRIKTTSKEGQDYIANSGDIFIVPKGYSHIEIIKPKGMQGLSKFWEKVGD